MSEVTSLITSVTLIAATSTLSLAICGYTLNQFYCKDSSEWIDKTYRNLTTAAMIAFTLTTIADGVHLTIKLLYFPNRVYDPFKERIPESIIDACYLFGSTTFYILILNKISVPFQLNKCIHSVLILFITLFGVTSVVYCIYILLTPANETLKYGVFILPVLYGSDLILNTHILGIFICKMRQTITDIDPRLSGECERNVNLISNTMTKHCVLFGTAIITNQAFYLSFISHLTDELTVTIQYSVPYSLRALENMINIIVLWLVLKISYDKYICFCKCCHLCVARCCMKDTTKFDSTTTVNNPYYQLIDL